MRLVLRCAVASMWRRIRQRPAPYSTVRPRRGPWQTLRERVRHVCAVGIYLKRENLYAARCALLCAGCQRPVRLGVDLEALAAGWRSTRHTHLKYMTLARYSGISCFFCKSCTAVQYRPCSSTPRTCVLAFRQGQGLASYDAAFENADLATRPADQAGADQVGADQAEADKLVRWCLEWLLARGACRAIESGRCWPLLSLHNPLLSEFNNRTAIREGGCFVCASVSLSAFSPTGIYI